MSLKSKSIRGRVICELIKSGYTLDKIAIKYNLLIKQVEEIVEQEKGLEATNDSILPNKSDIYKPSINLIKSSVVNVKALHEARLERLEQARLVSLNEAELKATQDSKRAILVRNWDIINMLHQGMTYLEVGTKLSLSQNQIKKIADIYQLESKEEIDAKINERLIDDINYDLDSNRNLDYMCYTYGKTVKELVGIYKKHTGDDLLFIMRVRRDEVVAFDFSMGLTANQIVAKHSALSPDMPISVSLVYNIARHYGVGRAINKISGGCNLDEEVIGIMRNKHRLGWTYEMISEHLNTNGYKPIRASKFNRDNVAITITKYIKKKGKKRLGSLEK